jgi:hypothetical protein
MKYIIAVLLSIFLMFSLSVIAKAAPNNLVIDNTGHIVMWDRSIEPVVTGYYVYWRIPVTPPTTPNPWVNTQRSALIPQSTVGLVPTYDLYTPKLAIGTYDIAATATDSSGNESGVSNIVPFVQKAPYLPLASPVNMRKL